LRYSRFVYVVVIEWRQAYSSQYISLVLFGLVMCEDKLSMQPRRHEIIQGLRKLPGLHVFFHLVVLIT